MSTTKPSSSSSDWEPLLPDELQRMLPQYEITGILGRGGMGAVYRGRQTKLGRTVAIKVLPNTFTKGEDELNFAKRFEQEAQAMANLDHPAIISVYDFGETAEGQLYFVMEFIDGMDIHQYLQHHGGKLLQESALAITAHVLDALDYAHNHGIVHRDIKPANILLNHEGRVKIADFGLAKKLGAQADADAPALTMSNVAVGTPDFVAPEALDSQQTPDHRADLYAVGVMLYQMLTGKLPRGNVRMPSELHPEIDPRLDEIVCKAMESDPAYRYQTAMAMRVDLDLVLSQPMARVQSGDRSGAVAAVVPVTTSVRGGKAAKPASKATVFLGVGLAAVLVVGLVVMATRGDHVSPTGTAGVSSGEPLPAPEALPGQNGGRDARGPSLAEGEETSRSDYLPAEEKVAPASPPVSSSTGGVASRIVPGAPLPVNSVETKTESPADALAPAFDASPSRKTNDGSPGETPVLPSPDPLANLPGLQTRLEGYLTARRTQLTELATKYRRGLDSRLNQAADAGDLTLSTAFQEEKASLDSLFHSLASPLDDPVAEVRNPAVLPKLAEESPEGLVNLRQTWNTESDKILLSLDALLLQSLQTLESELTRARGIDQAIAVLAFRESLAATVLVLAIETEVAENGQSGSPAGKAETEAVAEGETFPVNWIWGSGGTLHLYPDGTAKHSRWSEGDGSWRRVSTRRLKLTHPNGSTMEITLQRDGTGEVRADDNRTTKITPLPAAAQPD